MSPVTGRARRRLPLGPRRANAGAFGYGDRVPPSRWSSVKGSLTRTSLSIARECRASRRNSSENHHLVLHVSLLRLPFRQRVEVPESAGDRSTLGCDSGRAILSDLASSRESLMPTSDIPSRYWGGSPRKCDRVFACSPKLADYRIDTTPRWRKRRLQKLVTGFLGLLRPVGRTVREQLGGVCRRSVEAYIGELFNRRACSNFASHGESLAIPSDSDTASQSQILVRDALPRR